MKKQSGLLPLRKQHIRHVPREITSDEASYSETTGLNERGKGGLTCERAEGVGRDLRTQGIQSHRLGLGLCLGLG